MCIRDSQYRAVAAAAHRGDHDVEPAAVGDRARERGLHVGCLLYTSDAADERSSVDLGGRRIIKKKNTRQDKHEK